MSERLAANNKTIAKNTAFLYVRMIFALLVSLYTTRVILHSLGVVDYGIYNVVAGFVSMFSFLNTSMTNGIQRFYNFKLGSEGSQSLIRVYNLALLIQLGLTIILLVILESFGLWYLETQMVIPADRLPAARWIFQFSVISLILVVLQIPYSAAIMAHERMDYYAYVSIFDAVARLGIALVIPRIAFDKLISYGFLCCMVSVANFLAYYVYAKVKFPEIRLRLQRDKALLKSMVSFSGWNIFGTFAYMLKNQGLNLLLNAFFGPVVNAARGVSSMIMGAIHGFSSNIVISFRPQLIQSYALGDTERVKKMFFSLSKISYILLFSLSCPVVIEISYILHLWLGSDVPDYTIPFTILVLVNMVISSLHTPLTQIVHAVGRIKTFQLAISIIICSILPISWLCLKLGAEPTAVYWVSLIITILNQVICLFIVRALFPFSIKVYLRTVIIPCAIYSLICPILPLIPFYLMEESFLRLVTVVIVSIITSCVLSYFGVMDANERRMVKSFIKKH